MTSTTVTLIIGTPTAGKSSLSALIATARASGHEVLHLKDLGIQESAELVGQVLDEVRLRAAEPGTVGRPMLLAVSDFDALMVPPVMPIDLPPARPAIIRSRELMISQQQIRAGVGRIVREGRGTGVSIAVVTSDPETLDLHRVFRDAVTTTIHGPSQ